MYKRQELKDANVTMLGRARQVKVTKENTIIVDGAGESSAIKDRIAQINNQIAVTTVSYTHLDVYKRQTPFPGPRRRSSGRPSPRAPA